MERRRQGLIRKAPLELTAFDSDRCSPVMAPAASTASRSAPRGVQAPAPPPRNPEGIASETAVRLVEVTDEASPEVRPRGHDDC